jgi:predicted DCC family thiol-disulfide oxidoreductase YuxK
MVESDSTSGFADVQGVVLATAAQDLDGALDLELAPDQRIDAPLLRHLVQIGGVLLERAAALGIALALGAGLLLVGLLLGDLRKSVRDVVHHVQARHVAAI